MTYLRNRKVALLIMRLTFILKSPLSVARFLKPTVSSEPVFRFSNSHFYIYELTPFYTSVFVSFFLFTSFLFVTLMHLMNPLWYSPPPQ